MNLIAAPMVRPDDVLSLSVSKFEWQRDIVRIIQAAELKNARR